METPKRVSDNQFSSTDGQGWGQIFPMGHQSGQMRCCHPSVLPEIWVKPDTHVMARAAPEEVTQINKATADPSEGELQIPVVGGHQGLLLSLVGTVQDILRGGNGDIIEYPQSISHITDHKFQ